MLNNCMYKWVQSLLPGNKSFLCINISIQKLQSVTLSDPPLDTLPEWYMTSAYHVTAHSASNSPHVDPYNSFRYVWPCFLTVPHAAHLPRSPWPTIYNFQNLVHVEQVCADSYTFGCMNQCSMPVVIHPGSHCALTAPSITPMTSLT